MITAPNVLVVHPSVPAKTVPEFVAWLKCPERQGLLRLLRHRPVAAPVGRAWFLQLTGTKAEHIPYRGAAPALQDLTAGVTQFFFDNLTTGIEFVRAGKLQGARHSPRPQRNPLTPELVPICETMPELKPFDVSTWFGVFLPAATPRPVIAAFNAQMKSWLDDPKTKERFTQMAGFPAYGTPAGVRQVRHQPDRAVEGRDRQGKGCSSTSTDGTAGKKSIFRHSRYFRQRAWCGGRRSTPMDRAFQTPRHPDRSRAQRSVVEDLFCCCVDKKVLDTPPSGGLGSGGEAPLYITTVILSSYMI